MSEEKKHVYAPGGISAEESSILEEKFKVAVKAGESPLAALNQVAGFANRRPAVIANSAKCPWAHGILPEKKSKKPVEKTQLEWMQVALNTVKQMSSQYSEALSHITDPRLYNYTTAEVSTMLMGEE